MADHSHRAHWHSPVGRVLVGTLLLAWGAVQLADNLNVPGFDGVAHYFWPGAALAWGVVAMLFGLGRVPGIIATVIFAMPPAVRLTNLGIRQVNEEIVEAGQSFGCNGRQLLFKVQLPNAMPSIMAGVNQTIMMALGMVVIASMIGVRGLGQEVLYGLQRQEPGTGFVAGLSIVLLAIVLDRITQAYGRRLAAHRQAAH